MNGDMLAQIETYYDAVPRSSATVEELYPFVLFVQKGTGWAFYARPQLGASVFTAADVIRVLDRQRALGIPQAFEWVAERTPSLRAAATAAGLRVTDYPLLTVAYRKAIDRDPLPEVTIRRVTPQDHLSNLGAVAGVGFSFPGTARSDAGLDEVAHALEKNQSEPVEFLRNRIATDATVIAMALVLGETVAVGSHQPVDSVSEVTGVATLPAFRRRGIGAALTALPVRDAWERGVRTVFLSAGDGDVARVYERVGFTHIGTACIASPLDTPESQPDL